MVEYFGFFLGVFFEFVVIIVILCLFVVMMVVKLICVFVVVLCCCVVVSWCCGCFERIGSCVVGVLFLFVGEVGMKCWVRVFFLGICLFVEKVFFVSVRGSVYFVWFVVYVVMCVV